MPECVDIFKTSFSQGFFYNNNDLFCLPRYIISKKLIANLPLQHGHTLKPTLILACFHFKFVSWRRQQNSKTATLENLQGNCFRWYLIYIVNWKFFCLFKLLSIICLFVCSNGWLVVFLPKFPRAPKIWINPGGF